MLAAGCAAPLMAPTLVRDPKFNYPATEAKEETLERGIAWLKGKGVKVDPVERDVIVP